MSPEEFENYLTLLTRLLRIDPKQRAQVAQEFRSHLEDRLDELLARGVPREAAIQTALEEFGDASALAAEYVALSRNRIRRRIMRLTTASVAATVLIAAAIFTFWPGTNAGPGPAATIAQDLFGDSPAAAAAAPAAPHAAQGRTLNDKLSQRLDSDYRDTPLKDAISHLGSATDITFYLKTKRLEEAGVNPDVPVTIAMKNIRVSTLLDLMLEELDLVYTEKDDLVVITTAEDAESTMEVRVYDCRDLIAMPTGLPGRSEPGMPGMEMPGGGESYAPPGSGSDYPGIGLPPSTFPGGAPGGARGGTARATESAPPSPARRIPTLVPSPAGESPDAAEGIPAAPRTVAPRGGDDVLPQSSFGGGGYGASGRPAAGGSMPGMAGMSGMGPGIGGGMGRSGGVHAPQPLSEQDLKAEQLMDILTTAVDPDTWSTQGGPGTIGQYNGLIVVSQSARTHTKVEKVLDMLRQAASRPKSPKNPVVR